MPLSAFLSSQRRTVAIAVLASAALTAGALISFGPEVLPQHLYAELGVGLFVGGLIVLLLSLTHLLVAAVRTQRIGGPRRVVLLPSPHNSESDEESDLLHMSEQDALKLAVHVSSQWTTAAAAATADKAKKTVEFVEPAASSSAYRVAMPPQQPPRSAAARYFAPQQTHLRPVVYQAVPMSQVSSSSSYRYESTVVVDCPVQRAKQELMDLL